MTNPTKKDVFDRLDEWRHFAGFPLEARAHPYFGLFLAGVFSECLKIHVKPIIIPELPYLKNASSNRSPKVDFFAVSKDCKHAFLVEIKTDMNYLDKEQVDNLTKAAENGMDRIIGNIRCMANNTKNAQSSKKYQCLLHALESLVTHNAHTAPEIKVIYVLPNKSSRIPSAFTQITFKAFADAIKGRGAIAERFAQSLISWVEPAGSQKP